MQFSIQYSPLVSIATTYMPQIFVTFILDCLSIQS